MTAQTYTIRTQAGGGPLGGLSGISYGLNHPSAVAVDSSGNTYVALDNWCQVWVVNASGTLVQVIGNGACGFSGDGGPATLASLSGPSGVAVDGKGNIYIADTLNNRIRRVSGGIITTVAGTGSAADYNGDNISATTANLPRPLGVGTDGSGNLYIAGACRVNKVSKGIITTVAGFGETGYNGDNISATFASVCPSGVAVDNSGNIYLADSFVQPNGLWAGNFRVRKISAGIITTVAGNGKQGGEEVNNISATSASITPASVAVDNAGNFYFTDPYVNRIRLVSGGIILTIHVDTHSPPGIYGVATGIAYSGGNIWACFAVANKVLTQLAADFAPSTAVLGNDLVYEGDGFPGPNAVLTQPKNSAVDSIGNVYIADDLACVVRKVSGASQIVTKFAGTGVCGYNGDGINPNSALLNGPLNVAVDSSGAVYISESGNQRVRKVSGGTITTIAGVGTAGYNGDNISAQSAQLNNPAGIALDPSGNLYIADVNNLRIRKVSGGTISTVAGIGTAGNTVDNIPATFALFQSPSSISIDSNSNLYIADSAQSKVFKVSSGTISTVAGKSGSGYNGDGISATAASLFNPSGVAVDSAQNIYIADTKNHRVRKVSGGIISTIAGTGTPGFSGDNGVAVQAMINSPQGVALDAGGNVYIADTGNNRIRKLTADACFYSLSPSSSASLVADASSYGVSVNAPGGCPWTSFNNYFNWFNITGGASGFGNGTVSYNVQANPNAGVRTGYLSIAGINLALTQAGLGCQVGLTPSSASWGSPGTANGSIAAGFSGQDCSWTATPSVPWITINSGSSGTGNGTITYSVSGNGSVPPRGGAINISVSNTGTQANFNIDQAGSACSYALSQSSQSFSSAGGSGSAAIVAPGGCLWTANSNASWLAITSGSSGSGSGTVNYSVQPNLTSSFRSGTLVIGGQSYVVTEAPTTGTLNCMASAASVQPPLVALEGRTEQVGDLLLTCSGMTSPITADIVLTLNNTAITNKIIAAPNTSDAMLINGATNVNGQILGYTAVHWPGVTLTPSSGSASVRITNVRADATLLGVTANLKIPAITGKLAVNSNVAVPVTNANQALADAASTLSLQVGPPNPLTGGPQTTIPVSYQELTITSFQMASGNSPATRFRMVITGIPSSVQVYAPVNPAGGAGQGQLYSADCSGAGGSPIAGVSLAGGTYSQLTVTGGSATATWVVLAADPVNFDTLTFPVLLQNATVGDLNQIQISGSYAPVAPAGAVCGAANPSSTAVPRYRDPAVLQNPVNARLTTSVSPAASASQLSVTKMRAASKPDAVLRPDQTPSINVNFTATLTNESFSQSMSNGSVRGTVPTGRNPIACIASNGGACTTVSDGSYSCTWANLSPEQSVSCSGYGQLDASYDTTVPVVNSAGASADQPPADPTTVVSSSSALVTGSGPTLQMETPDPTVATTVSGLIRVSGWAIDQNTAIQSVQIFVDGNLVGSAVLGGIPATPNVCNVYAGWVGCPDGHLGFSYMLNTAPFGNGAHILAAVATNSASPAQSTMSKTAILTVQNPAMATKVGVFRNSAAFLEDTNGNGVYDPGVDKFIPSFTGPSGFIAGDYPVAGDWTGTGQARVGIYRSSTGEWFLDTNNNGVFDGGDASYRFGGVSGDLPVVGDWLGQGKSCIGIFRQGFFWVLDLNCNGSFDGTDKGQDAAFPFGGVAGDVPVVGAWAGGKTRVGVVRKYAPAGVPIGNPFFWVVDSGDPDGASTPAAHQPDYPRCFAFGGLAGDVFLAGDWYGNGVSGAAVYRSGLWVLDAALPNAPQSEHLKTPVTFSYGGAATDVPVVGKW
jgi:hypothetical protein